MRNLIAQLRFTPASLSPGRAVVMAMLLGPLVGAMLAAAAVAADNAADTVTIDNEVGQS
jgi:hypothetical protein